MNLLVQANDNMLSNIIDSEDPSHKTGKFLEPKRILREKTEDESPEVKSVTKTIKKDTILKKSYDFISDDLRLELIDAVKNRNEKIKHAAKRLGINYSSAKSICQIFEKEGRANRILIKKRGLRESSDELSFKVRSNTIPETLSKASTLESSNSLLKEQSLNRREPENLFKEDSSSISISMSQEISFKDPKTLQSKFYPLTLPQIINKSPTSQYFKPLQVPQQILSSHPSSIIGENMHAKSALNPSVLQLNSVSQVPLNIAQGNVLVLVEQPLKLNSLPSFTNNPSPQILLHTPNPQAPQIYTPHINDVYQLVSHRRALQGSIIPPELHIGNVGFKKQDLPYIHQASNPLPQFHAGLIVNQHSQQNLLQSKLNFQMRNDIQYNVNVPRQNISSIPYQSGTNQILPDYILCLPPQMNL